MSLRDYELSDRYLSESGTVMLSGIQALARIPIEQLRLDQRAGLRTGGFVSGYPGSPVGGLGQEIDRALRLVPDLQIIHPLVVNEELAASAVMGSQLAETRPDVEVDGVVGMWYGKAPGLDRATDAIRHGVFAGSSAHGGALAVVGDDPVSKSSTMPSSSDAALVDLHMPILYPGTVGECLELGLHGVAMSRATGLWSALKIVTPIADGIGTVSLPALDQPPVVPTVEIDGRQWTPNPSAQFLGPRMVAVEKEFHEVRSELARRYGIENELNRMPCNRPDAWIGLLATGFTYHQVLESLRRLGLETLDDIAGAGIRLLQLRMPVPFNAEQVVEFGRGLKEIFVIEEKNPTLERLVRDCLYDATHRPVVNGKQDRSGTTLLPSHGQLDADAITPALRSRLAPVLGDRIAPPPPPPRELIPLQVQRTPFFCSGCPHNWGTKVSEGSVVGMGTGCHGMTLLMEEDRVGESIGITAMGNEGAQWLGMAPFVGTDHVFQNLGDGTFFHSGQLAIQAAIGAGADMTYKILYNDTVAMTGGQDAAHSVGVIEMARILLDMGVTAVAITTEDVARYRGGGLPRSVKVHDRTELVEVQDGLARVKGVTVLIHDQACAAELRRARRRGTLETPTERVVINHRICEGCGDCGDVSNCLSVQPVDTPLGRKTQIDQASCNLDLSCLGGDCPAFMTVDTAGSSGATTVGAGRSPEELTIDQPVPVDAPATVIRMAGIGGTGVVTAAQIVATAALLAGLEVAGVDQTGLSQKAGPVISDVTIYGPDQPARSNVVGLREADVLLAFDGLVGTSDAAIGAAGSDTAVFTSTSRTPTGAQITQPDLAGPTDEQIHDRFATAADPSLVREVDSIGMARALTGTAGTANIFMIGVAVQSGRIPVPVEAVAEAIRLNGVAVEANLAALAWGRRWLARPDAVASAADNEERPQLRFDVADLPAKLRARLDGRAWPSKLTERAADYAADLVAYQDEAYAARFLDLVESAFAAGGEPLAAAVAANFHKLLAYKDEYEVARLMLSDDGLAPARALTGDLGHRTLTWMLHPPLLRAVGVDRKLRFGSRSIPTFKALARGKRLRGTRLDPFGMAEVRRIERELIPEYEQAVTTACRVLESSAPDRADETLGRAVAMANLPDHVRGFEDLKVRRAGEYREKLAAALAALG